MRRLKMDNGSTLGMRRPRNGRAYQATGLITCAAKAAVDGDSSTCELFLLEAFYCTWTPGSLFSTHPRSR